MNDYSIFEFTQSLFNERTLAVFVNNVLQGVSLNDDILSQELFDYHVQAEEYIKTNNYSNDIQKAIEVGMQNDFHKIYSIINSSLLKQEQLPTQFFVIVRLTAEKIILKSRNKETHTYFVHIESSISKFLADLKDNFPNDKLDSNKSFIKNTYVQSEEVSTIQNIDPKSFIKFFKSKGSFKSHLGTKEIALLLHLLSSENIIPKYTNQNLGIIGSILFHKDYTNIASSLGKDVHHKDNLQAEIANLTQTLQTILTKLNEWTISE